MHILERSVCCKQQHAGLRVVSVLTGVSAPYNQAASRAVGAIMRTTCFGCSPAHSTGSGLLPTHMLDAHMHSTAASLLYFHFVACSCPLLAVQPRLYVT